MSNKIYFVFDVESIGLHGEGFAVGYVVVDSECNQLDSGLFACLPSAALGSMKNHGWVRENVPEIRPTHTAPWLVRAAFWRTWLGWKSKGALMVSDCGWPVEARFLAQCVDDNPTEREWQGPYPLHDLATVMMVQGADPIAVRERLPNELPAHNPLTDAAQTARLLLAALHPSTKTP